MAFGSSSLGRFRRHGWHGGEEALAQEGLYIPLLTYRTGALCGPGIPIANGMRDYLTMLNERDGGIGGVKLTVEECETGYDTQKGVECYEAPRPRAPSSTIRSRPASRCSSSRRPRSTRSSMLSMAYGLSASAIGKDVPVGLQPARLPIGTACPMIIKVHRPQEGGLDKL